MKNKINNKGFTLVELLAVVAILGIIMSIATISVVSTINESKTKSEKLFVKKLSQSIDDYIDLYSSNLKTTSNQYTFDKCTEKKDVCPEDAVYSINAYEVKENGITDITLQDLIDANLIEKSKLINPRNKLQCVDLEHNPTIKIYKDSDYVYYYKVDLSTSACEISEENNEINTLPADLNRKVG